MTKKNNANILLALALIILTVGYGIFNARTLMRGPVVTITDPLPGETLTETLLIIEGSAKNVTRVRVNGRPITLDQQGAFMEKLVTQSGYGTVVVEAENRFGQHTRKVVEYVGKPG